MIALAIMFTPNYTAVVKNKPDVPAADAEPEDSVLLSNDNHTDICVPAPCYHGLLDVIDNNNTWEPAVVNQGAEALNGN